jgi:Asp-tRNA(Asn)/Glu-tRNA(Gln) amidotransferase A subunit family amidase
MEARIGGARGATEGAAYDPATARYLCFADARHRFAAGDDTPRAYLERCLERIEQTEPAVRAFTTVDTNGARAAADAASARWKSGRPISLVDGMPVGIKDCFDVKGFVTACNSPLFADNRATIDAAHVDALRRGGAVILGKTVTTELTTALPGPTWNPWDLERTPGGSSSGSAAAVAARMLPLATGSQVRGSILRPASICGVVGMKPTFGAINRFGGIDLSPSCNHLGFLAGTLTDAWETAHYIASVAGGDPGCEPLVGSARLPAARKPVRVGTQYTAGWAHTDETSKTLFRQFLDRVTALGIEVIEPTAGQELADYEDATARTPEFFFDVMLWEIRWPSRIWREMHPEALSEPMAGYVARAEQMTPEEYRRALRRRDDLRNRHRALRGRVDCFVSLAHIGPGQKGQPRGGTPWFNDASSAIGAPSFSLPLLATDGVPLGIQIVGFERDDEDLAGIARMLLGAFGSQTVGPG